MAMGGYNVKFNISLSKCTTPDCSYEKATYDSSSSSNSTISSDSTSNDSDIYTSVYASSCT